LRAAKQLAAAITANDNTIKATKVISTTVSVPYASDFAVELIIDKTGTRIVRLQKDRQLDGVPFCVS
jgi:hypothetical protein